jgi:plasmid segregation protein ParM
VYHYYFLVFLSDRSRPLKGVIHLKNIAVDAGFGRTKALSAERAISFPSLVAHYREVRFTTGMEGNGDPTSKMVIESNGRRYFVGSAAGRQGIVQNTIDRDRAISEEAKLLTLGALSLLMEESPEHINLVAGLPVSHYASLKERYISELKQTHYFDLLDLSGKTLNKHIVNVHEVKVIPQPLGTLFNMLLNEQGGLSRAELAGENVGIVDIGFHTVDLARADSLEFIDRKSASYPLGLFNAFSELSEEIGRSLDIEAPPETLENVVSSGQIKVGGKSVSIEKQKQQAFTHAAEQILSKVKTLWPDRWQLDRIIVTGGGGHLLYDYLKLNLDQQAELAHKPVFANAEGYLKLAARSWGVPDAHNLQA